MEDCFNQSDQQIHVLQTLLHNKKKDAAVGVRADVMRETDDCSSYFVRLYSSGESKAALNQWGANNKERREAVNTSQTSFVSLFGDQPSL